MLPIVAYGKGHSVYVVTISSCIRNYRSIHNSGSWWVSLEKWFIKLCSNNIIDSTATCISMLGGSFL